MTKILRASEIGAKLDSNVAYGGGTDDTAVLQKALDEAKSGGVHLILDGAALVTGLVVHSNTTIECPNKDCGLFLADNANDAVIHEIQQNYEIGYIHLSDGQHLIFSQYLNFYYNFIIDEQLNFQYDPWKQIKNGKGNRYYGIHQIIEISN